MSLHKPIVIVGTGRCGSTMLHRVIARHEDIGWLSTFNEVFPTQPWLSRFSNLYRTPHLGMKVKHLPFFPKPFEAYKYWEHYLPGFSRRDKPQTAADVPTAAIKPVHKALTEVMRHQKKSRFLVKVTGWSRIAYFNEIFPDAVFIFLNREHRAVVSSWVQAGWLDVTSGLDSAAWQWGEVPAEYRQLWEELGANPLLSAAVKIQLDLDDIRRSLPMVEGRYYRLQYEDLITEPQKYLREMLAFCDIAWTEQYAREVASMTFYNPVDKWKKYLTEDEGDVIQEFFARAAQCQIA